MATRWSSSHCETMSCAITSGTLPTLVLQDSAISHENKGGVRLPSEFLYNPWFTILITTQAGHALIQSGIRRVAIREGIDTGAVRM